MHTCRVSGGFKCVLGLSNPSTEAVGVEKHRNTYTLRTLQESNEVYRHNGSVKKCCLKGSNLTTLSVKGLV
eukprot:1394419-Amorphochlora_amoeboformis.AAC.3